MHMHARKRDQSCHLPVVRLDVRIALHAYGDADCHVRGGIGWRGVARAQSEDGCYSSGGNTLS